jgi:hypothetical protein
MTQPYEVLEMLLPEGGWVMYGNDFEGIQFLECDPITKEQYEAGFAQVETFQAQQAQTKAAEKAALLAKLGITEEEAALLLGGN